MLVCIALLLLLLLLLLISLSSPLSAGARSWWGHFCIVIDRQGPRGRYHKVCRAVGAAVLVSVAIIAIILIFLLLRC